MSKFDEMVAARTSCATLWTEYRNRSYKNLIALAQGFAEYCCVPEGCFALAPLDKDIEPNTHYGPAGAIHFDTEDVFWRLGMIITLRDSLGALPQGRVLLEIAVREDAAKVFVKLGREDKGRQIDPSKQEECNSLYDRVVDRVKRFYSASTDGVLGDAGQAPRRIGFTGD